MNASMTAPTCTRRRVRSMRLATVAPPRTPLHMNGNAIALISSLAQKCPETVYCVVAPLVLGCLLVFNGFQSYNNDKRKGSQM